MTRHQDRFGIDGAEWRKRIRPELAHRAEYRCERCGTFTGLHGHGDHVIPRATGNLLGIDVADRDNLQWLCPGCHNAKSMRERWAGHTPRDRSGEIRRANVPGREAFHRALAEGMAELGGRIPR